MLASPPFHDLNGGGTLLVSACGAGGARRLFFSSHDSGCPAQSTPGPSAYSGTDNRPRDLGESAAAAALAPGQHSHISIPGQLPHWAHEHCRPAYAGCGPLDEDTGLRLAASAWGRVSRSEASCCLMSPCIRQMLSILSPACHHPHNQHRCHARSTTILCTPCCMSHL